MHKFLLDLVEFVQKPVTPGGGGRRTEEDEEDESTGKIEALKKSASKQQKRKDYFYDENFQQNNNSEGQPMSLNIDDQRRLKNWGSGGQNGHQRSRNNLERSDSMFTSSQMNLTRHHQRSRCVNNKTRVNHVF